VGESADQEVHGGQETESKGVYILTSKVSRKETGEGADSTGLNSGQRNIREEKR